MRYLIDGYNLSFRIQRFSHQKFQFERESWINWLNTKLSALSISAAIVYDATHSPGLEERQHKGSLEILYTSFGQSADEWIIAKLSHGKFSSTTVVTSDKRLASQVRYLGAKTLTVEAFIEMVERRIEKRLEPKKLVEPVHPPKPTIQPPISSNLPNLERPFSPHSDKAFSYYLEQFEKKAAESGEGPLPTQGKTLDKREASKRRQEASESPRDRWQRLFTEGYQKLTKEKEERRKNGA
jgi:predicted RNA-binding protein with PIN domain